jgi:mannose-6-phosphate isomerase-like protein (cupin superfamily)
LEVLVMNPVTVKLFAPSALRLADGGTVQAETPPRMSGDVAGWAVATFHAETDADVHADYWEIHPAAEEAVCVLTGHARLILRAGEHGGEQSVDLPAPTAVVVPRNHWHRLEIDGPTDLMSVTMRTGTHLEPRDQGAGGML